jgi:elongation factor Ts
MKINADQLRKLREQTGAPVMRVKQVLEKILSDLPANATPQALQAGEKKALEILKKEGFEKAAKRSDRATSQGLIEAYVHHSGKIVSLVELLCETDFVARNELFKTLAHDLALQVASSEAKKADDLLKEEFIKDPSKKVEDLVKDVIAKTGENVKIGRIFKFELGKN